MIAEVTMYRVVCDADGCDASAQEDGDYYAWMEVGTALDDAREGCWYVGEFGEFCEEHAPYCPCGAPIRDDDDHEDGLCEDCQPVEAAS